MKKNFALFLILTASTFVNSSAFCSEVTPVNLLKAQADELVHSLQAAELWIGGAVAVSNGVDTKVSTYGFESPDNTQVPIGTSHFEIGGRFHLS
jgi:hypothetical protein